MRNLKLAVVFLLTISHIPSAQAETANSQIQLKDLISNLKGSTEPQKYMDLSICYESILSLVNRKDKWKIDLEESRKMKTVYDLNGPYDQAAKQIIRELCPGSITTECANKFPTNLQGWLQGVTAIKKNFNSSAPNDLIRGGSPGNNPLTQRNIMTSYCSKFGYTYK